MKLDITEAAARRILEIRADRGTDQSLRIGVEKGGCAGLQYVMEFDDAKPGDNVFMRDEAGVVVAPDAAPFLDGAIVDYVDDLAGAGFRLKNPNASRSCGCGTSFETSAAST